MSAKAMLMVAALLVLAASVASANDYDYTPAQSSQAAPMRGNRSTSTISRSEPVPDAQSQDFGPDPEQLISSWPQVSRTAAQAMIAKYGMPDTWSSDMLHFYNTPPFDVMIVHKDPVAHDFPMAHQDVLEQGVFFKVPVDKLDDLAAFDGSLLVDRTKGTLTARCDSEQSNMVALNLAKDIIDDRISVEDARAQLSQILTAFKQNGTTNPYMTALNFTSQGKLLAASPDGPATAVAAYTRTRAPYAGYDYIMGGPSRSRNDDDDYDQGCWLGSFNRDWNY